MKMILLALAVIGVLVFAAYSIDRRTTPPPADSTMPNPTFPVQKSDAEWKKILTPEQYSILREKGTERAGTGKYAENHAAGLYTCAACGQELFGSDAKFESGTGWPSFYQPIAPGAALTQTDSSFFMTRTEVLCARCGGHLGHVFDDGPEPTHLRYCINSAALNFTQK